MASEPRPLPEGMMEQIEAARIPVKDPLDAERAAADEVPRLQSVEIRGTLRHHLTRDQNEELDAEEHAALVLELQRIITLSLPFIPATESRLRGEMMAALSVRPNG